MNSDSPTNRLTQALTQASRGKLPPDLHVATGHEDEVMLFLLSVADAPATTQILLRVITLADCEAILDSLNSTGGLIRKQFPIGDARRLQEQLQAIGTTVKFVRPGEWDDAEAS